MTQSPQQSLRELLNKAEVVALLGLSIRTVERYSRLGLMPAPVQLGRLVKWRLADLRKWMAALPSAHTSTAPTPGDEVQ
jgi:predicted DNA-binding transcriptional regulator AlpA